MTTYYNIPDSAWLFREPIGLRRTEDADWIWSHELLGSMTTIYTNQIMAKVDQMIALVAEMGTQLATSRTTTANLLADLTGTTRASVFSTPTTNRGGRPRKS